MGKLWNKDPAVPFSPRKRAAPVETGILCMTKYSRTLVSQLKLTTAQPRYPDSTGGIIILLSPVKYAVKDPVSI